MEDLAANIGEVNAREALIFLGGPHKAPAVPLHKKLGERSLIVRKHPVERDESPIGSERRSRQRKKLTGLRVVQVMKDSHRQHDVEIAISTDQLFRYRRDFKLAASSESGSGRRNIAGIEINADVFDARKKIEPVSGSASDIEDPFIRLRAYPIRGKTPTESIATDNIGKCAINGTMFERFPNQIFHPLLNGRRLVRDHNERSADRQGKADGH
jgi:hypothetical protein